MEQKLEKTWNFHHPCLRFSMRVKGRHYLRPWSLSSHVQQENEVSGACFWRLVGSRVKWLSYRVLSEILSSRWAWNGSVEPGGGGSQKMEEQNRINGRYQHNRCRIVTVNVIDIFSWLIKLWPLYKLNYKWSANLFDRSLTPFDPSNPSKYNPSLSNLINNT